MRGWGVWGGCRTKQLSIITSLRHGNENSILLRRSRYQQEQLPNAARGSSPAWLPILPTLKPRWSAGEQI